MSKRRQYKEGKHYFTADDWFIHEKGYNAEKNETNETLFAVGNGYIGMRATFEEGYSGPGKSTTGIFINGFFEKHPIHYAEAGYGYAKNDEVMLNVTNSIPITLHIAGEAFDMFRGEVLSYSRLLHFRSGVMTRQVTWKSPKGHEVQVNIKRMALQTNKHVAVIRYEVTPLNFDGTLEIVSSLDGAVTNIQADGNDPRVGSHMKGQSLQTVGRKQEKGYAALEQHTVNSGFALVCAMQNVVEAKGLKNELSTVDTPLEGQKASVKLAVEGKQGVAAVLIKYIAYVSSRDYPKDELHTIAKNELAKSVEAGYSELETQQHAFYNEFWAGGDIDLVGDPWLQQGLRFNMFHLVQSAGRDETTNIAAKGLTGEGYGGHYFWDSEIYIVPFLCFTSPHIAKPLLLHRYHTLEYARARAKELNINKGCLFPWRTIAGEECSSYFPAGTAQFHINADIAYAVKLYIQATGDEEFAVEYGAEIMFETARSWIELGVWQAGFFQIHGVTGPDEYTAIVDNNFYTNTMAKMNMEYATELYKNLYNSHREGLLRVAEKIGLDPSEPDAWQEAGKMMWLPHDKLMNIHPQDDSFLKKKVWDFENTPKEKYPLLINYHPLVIYKHRVCKQADLILVHYLASESFTLKEKKADFDFYEPLTTHDSSLSTSIFSIVASEIGYHTKAYDYFMNTARMDIDDVNKNTHHGIHTACMGGTWLCMVAGFGGMRLQNGMLSFDPYLPMEWESYGFNFFYKGSRLRVDINAKSVTYKLVKGKSIRFIHSRQTRVTLKEGKSVALLLKDKFTDIATLEFDACIFDMDVLTGNIDVIHEKAWLETLNTFLKAKGTKDATAYKPLSHQEYEESVKHSIADVDRYAGLSSFLATRGIDIPVGTSDDTPLCETLHALGNAKRKVFREVLEQEGITVDPHILAFLRDLREEGIQLGCVSYSKNCRWILEHTGLAHLFHAIVGGNKFSKLGLSGPPQVDIYTKAAEELNTQPRRSVVFVKDATPYNHDSFRHFKLVVGTDESHSYDADHVCTNFDGVTTDLVEEWVKTATNTISIKRRDSFRREVSGEVDKSSHTHEPAVMNVG